MFYEELNYRLNIIDKNLPTMIFLHGWGCSMKSFKYFERFFSCDLNTLNIDLYGFGQSSELRNVDMYDYTKKIYLFLRSKNITNIIIVSHSFGFRIATILSTCFDIEVKCVVVTGGAGCKPRFSLINWFKIIHYKQIVKNEKRKNLKTLRKCKKNQDCSRSVASDKMCQQFENNNEMDCEKIKDKYKDKKYGSVDYKESSVEMKKFLVKVVNQHLDYLYKLFNCCLLLYWGRRDKATPLYMATKLCKYSKKIKPEFMVVSGDHFCFMNDKEYFARVIKKFLVSQFILK